MGKVDYICIDYIEPMGKPRMTRADKWKQRDCVVKYRAYADQLRLAAEIKGFELGDKFEIEFGFPIPKSASAKKRKELLGMPHQVKPDIDNLLKGVMDALKENDQTVWSVKAVKYYASLPKIEIYNLDWLRC